jgi:hypothetical protein
MSSIVIELQKDALDASIPVAALLRKALVVARKLKIAEIQEWIENELNDYSKNCPEYRSVRGQVRVQNALAGSQVLPFQDAEFAELLSVRPCGKSIAEIERITADTAPDKVVYMFYGKEIEKGFMREMDTPEVPFLLIAPSEFIRILDRVRNTVLDWALKLEEQGILGDDLSFTPEEKAKASTVNYHFHDISGSQIQAGSNHSIQVFEQQLDLEKVKDFISEMKNLIDKIGLGAVQQEKLIAEIGNVETQLAASKPNAPVIRESLRSVRSILEGMVGSIIASGLLYRLGLFMPQ